MRAEDGTPRRAARLLALLDVVGYFRLISAPLGGPDVPDPPPDEELP